ncbi:MAG: protease complex subunit PrcB family protein [Candidatus Sericytochromatia bacterium]|nr:protease complex subunit PrcB family protein [Candidatus Sericytochromatia bacterium]
MLFSIPFFNSLLALSLGVALPAVGCGVSSERAGALASQDLSDRFVLLGTGERSGIEETLVGVARDADTWKAFWLRHDPEGPIPPIDFSRDMGILVIRPHTTGGYHLRIENLEQRSEKLILTLIEEQPREDDLVIQVLTQPWVALRCKHFAGPVQLQVIPRPRP